VAGRARDPDADLREARLFNVYDSPWFAAIYMLLMVSLVGCIVPRTFVYWRGLRAQPPAAPRNLTRLPEPRVVRHDRAPAVVLRARAHLSGATRVPSDAGVARGVRSSPSAGYLREAGNLLFHLSVLVVLVGFGDRQLFGYKGGVILVRQRLLQQPHAVRRLRPGSLFDADRWSRSASRSRLRRRVADSRPAQGMARGFQAPLTTHLRGPVAGAEQSYDLRVNHPLTIGGTRSS
jgi:cytochrome c biogenesis protein